MIVGNSSTVAIESGITRAFQRLSLRALGFFVIFVGGRCYGRRSPESTMLACSYDEVLRRVSMRGSHTAPFSGEPNAAKIADAFLNATYSDDRHEAYLALPQSQFIDALRFGRIVWAPDGDEAFDDGSYLLHFDVNDQARIIAFKAGQDYRHDPTTLVDVWIDGNDFYQVLQQWSRAFELEWATAPKADAPDSDK